MAELSASQRRRIDGISDRIGEYLNIRLQHAERVNPGITYFVDDLRSQLLMNLRNVLTKGRAWGTDKLLTADVLCGDDLDKRYQLLTTTGQYTIMHELIQTSEDHGEIGETLSVNTLGELYGSIDAQTTHFVKLTQIWLWWDLPDAICLHCFQTEVSRLEKLRAAEVNEQLTDHYHRRIGKLHGRELTKDVMLGFELRRMRRYLQEFELHRRDDLSHQIIIKRDVHGDQAIDDLLLLVASQVETLRELQEKEELTGEIRERFAQHMGADPEHLTHEAILRWQRDQVEHHKGELLRAGKAGRALGTPYNLKRHQLEEMHHDHDAVVAKLSEEALQFAELTQDASGE